MKPLASPKYTVERTYHFDAAHRLPQLPSGHKCHHLHGHTYKVEVAFTGDPNVLGFVIDYADIDRLVDPVIRALDHKYLNDIMPDTTAEYLAKYIFESVARHKPLSIAATVTRVRLWETARSCVEYGF